MISEGSIGVSIEQRRFDKQTYKTRRENEQLYSGNQNYQNEKAELSFNNISQFDINMKLEVIIMADFESPLAGKILEINMEVGQTVTEDDELIILEAMKMENPLFGPEGTVKEIKVKVGDKVEEGDVLAIIE